MTTGDGWLARLPPLTAPMTPAMLGALAAAAQRHGNGRIEITKRGNWQLRGLPLPDGTALADALAAGGFDLGEGIPVSLDPLADLGAHGAGSDGAGGRALVRGLHDAIAASGLAGKLAPKLTIALDLGTVLAPHGLTADLWLTLRGTRVHIALGGTAAEATPLGWVDTDDAIPAVIAILTRLARHGREARLAGNSGLAGVKGLGRDPAFATVAAFRPEALPERVATPATVGPIAGLPVAVHGIAFPFGQADAADLADVAAVATAAGLTAFAPASEHALLLAGPADAVATVLRRAAECGFITDAQDPRRFVAACAGSAGCLSGRYAARLFAADWTPRLAPLLDGSLNLHFSGCRKGCAHPAAADFTIAGIDKGAALVLDGRARDDAAGIGSPAELAARLAELADRVAVRPSGETARAALERLGLSGTLAGLAQEVV